MKRLVFILILILLCTFSCKDNSIERPDKPANLLTEEKMVDVLYDMVLLSAAKGVNKQIMETKGVYPDEYVYTKHKIDSIQFKESNTYYAYDIEQYERIYAKVKLKLEADKDVFQGKLDIERAKRDSIARSNKKRDSLKRVQNRKKKDSLDRKLIQPGLLKKEKQFP